MRGSEGGTEVEQEEKRKLENEGKGKGSSRNEGQERGEEKSSVLEGGRKGKADTARQKESREERARSVPKCEPTFFVPFNSDFQTLPHPAWYHFSHLDCTCHVFTLLPQILALQQGLPQPSKPDSSARQYSCITLAQRNHFLFKLLEHPS